MDRGEIGWGAMDWIDLADDTDKWKALVNAVMNQRVSQNSRNFLSGCRIGGFSRRAQVYEFN
jgi:hypothetical protein